MKDIDHLITVSYKRSFVIGMLLAGATSRRTDLPNKLRATFTVVHSLAQTDLAEWKASEVRRLFGLPIQILRNQQAHQTSFSFVQEGRLRVIHDWFHRANQKTITDKVRFLSHPIGLAVILSDCGFVHDSNSIGIQLPDINRASTQRLLEHITEFCGATGHLIPERDEPGATGTQLLYSGNEAQKLWECVFPWIPPIPSVVEKFSVLNDGFDIGSDGRHPTGINRG
jgi:hypothetical protein